MDTNDTPLKKSENEIKAGRIVQTSMGWSSGAGMLPLPVLDLAAIVAVQVTMLKSIADIYGVPFNKSIVKPLVVALLSSGGAYALAAPTTSLLKLVPILGTVAGILVMPSLAVASCYATGKVFIQHFESGGTFLDFVPSQVRQHYAECLKAAADKPVSEQVVHD